MELWVITKRSEMSNVYVERVDIVTLNRGDGIWGIVSGNGGEKEDPTPYSGPATINITVKDSSIKVAGVQKTTGLYATHAGSGKVEINVEDSLIEATDGAWGIYIDATGGERRDDLEIVVNVENSGDHDDGC